MDFVDEVLDVLWAIEGWKKDEMRNRKRVNQWFKEFPPDQVDLTKLARRFDVWCEGKEITAPTVATFDSFIRTLVQKGDVQPHRATIMGAALSVDEQLRLKDVKRKRELQAMGVKDD